jgi:hypothetical protein
MKKKTVEKLKGCYVKRKANAKTIYLVEGYNRSSRKWVLQDVEDFCRTIEVKKGTVLIEVDY